MVFVICAPLCKTLASKAGEQLPKCQNPKDQDNWLSYGSNLQSVNSATEEQGMESSSLENQNHQQILDNCLTEIGLILSSNRDFNQVYHQFTAQVKRLVEFDNIYVNVIHREAGLIERKYDAGLSLPHRSIPEARRMRSCVTFTNQRLHPR